MAMTKAERAEYERMLRELAILRALRWSDSAPEPDVAPSESGHTQGWLYSSRGYDPQVYEAWSESVAHGTGKYLGRNRPSGTQGARRLYSTRLLALRALRAAMERQYAEALARVDAQIAGEP